MNLAERIQAAEADLVTTKDSLVEATKALEAAPDEEALLVQVEELSTRVEKQSATVGALKKAEAALAARAAAQPPAAPATIAATPRAKGNGDLIVKMGVVSALAFAQRKSVQEVIADRYKDDQALPAVMDYVRKSAVEPATTTAAGWAAELVATDVRGFLDTMKENSVAAALALRSTMLDFGGFNSITVPRRNPLAGTLTEPAWVGETGAIPLTQFSFGAATISRYKLACITTMSREIAERSTPAIEGLLRDAISEAYAQVLDAALLSATAAVTGVRPAGLLNGVTVNNGAAGGGDAAVRADLKTLISALLTAKAGVRPVLLLNTVDRLSVSLMTSALGESVFSDELSSGRLLGLEVVSSGHVPAHTAILVDAAALATAFDAPMFDVSDVATVVEANANGTAPTMATGAAGAVGTAGQVPPDGGIMVSGSTGAATTGYTARSLWQTYSIGIRMVAPTSWAMLRPNSVVALDTLTW